MSYMENEETPFKAFIDTSVKMFATSTPFELVRGNHETRGKWRVSTLSCFLRRMVKYTVHTASETL